MCTLYIKLVHHVHDNTLYYQGTCADIHCIMYKIMCNYTVKGTCTTGCKLAFYNREPAEHRSLRWESLCLGRDNLSFLQAFIFFLHSTIFLSILCNFQ